MQWAVAIRRRKALAVTLTLVVCGVVFQGATPAPAAVGDFTVTPTTLNFPDTYVGDTSSIDVTIQNVSAVSQTPSFSGGAPSDATNFGGSQNCAGKTFAPGDTCMFTYEFHPTSAGTKSSSTTIGIDTENFPITMSGTGLFPFTVAPTTLNFPDTLVGSTSSIAVTIQNVSPVSQTPSFSGGAPSDATNFGGSQNCAGKTFAPGDTCMFTYEFHPTSAGTKSSSTTIGIDTENFPITMSGTGVGTVLTTTTVTASANPSSFGQTVTFTATVDASPFPNVPTGTVTFVDTSTATMLGTVVLNGSGQATFTTTTLATGGHVLQASYTPGSGSFIASSGSVTQIVNPAATSIAFSSSPNPSTPGQPVTFTADVTAASPSLTPTGTVTFVDLTTGTTLGTGTVNSPATLTIDSLAAGTHVIRATFNPSSGNFAVSSAELTLTVAGPASTSGPPSSIAFTGSSAPRLLGPLGLLLIAAGVLLLALRRRLA